MTDPIISQPVAEQLASTRYEILTKLSELERQVSATQDQIEKEHGPAIQLILRRWINAEHDENRGYGFPGPTVKFDWEIMGSEIYVKWDETWARGGQDNGSFFVPMACFTDNGETLEAFEKKRTEEKEAVKRQAQANEEAKERAQLAALQEKFKS